MMKRKNDMNLPPLVYYFFFEDIDCSKKMRIHCPEREQRETLLQIAEMFFDDFSAEYLHYSSSPYLLWDYHMGGTTPPVGFNGYPGPNNRTHSFEEFMAEAGYLLDGVCNIEEEIPDIGDLL